MSNPANATIDRMTESAGPAGVESVPPLARSFENDIETLGDDIAARRQIHLQLARTYLESGQEPEALRTARRLFERMDDARFAREIAKMVSLVEKLEKFERLTAISEQLLSREPNDPELALLHARQMHRSGAPRNAAFRALQRALELNPNLPGILLSLVRCAAGATRVPELEAEAETYGKRLVELSPTAGHFFVYGRLLLVRGKQAEALAAFENIGPRLDAAALAPLSEPLGTFCALCNENYRTDAATDLAALRRSLEQSRQGLEAFLDGSETITAHELDTAVRKLMPLRVPFFELVRLSQVSDAIGDHFGTLHLEPFCILAGALSDHLLTILEYALSERVLNRPLKTKGVVRKLAKAYSSLLLFLGQPARARDGLNRLAATGFAAQAIGLLQDAAALAEFEAGTEFAREQAGGGPQPKIALHRIAAWDEWISAQALPSRMLATAPGQKIEYSVVTTDGELRRGSYAQQAFRLEAVAARPVRLRDSEMVIGPKGLLLQPHPIHGRYPPPGLSSVLNTTPRSAALEPPEASLAIDEPVVLLAMNNCARLRSYGHWIIFLLSRLNALIEGGFLAQRKVLIPAEATAWMKEALTLIGLPEERIIYFPKDRQIVASDAEVISAVNFSGSDLLRKLKTRMRAGAGVERIDRRASATPFVFLARKAQMRRMILDEEKIYGVAQRLGYAIVSPETLSVADQVRLFSNVAAVAGPGGSAFANTVFCESGARSLCLKAEEKVSPFVLDLAIANDLEFRWLLGRSVPALVHHMHPLDVPFQVDLSELERQLAWAMEAAALQRT